MPARCDSFKSLFVTDKYITIRPNIKEERARIIKQWEYVTVPNVGPADQGGWGGTNKMAVDLHLVILPRDFPATSRPPKDTASWGEQDLCMKTETQPYLIHTIYRHSTYMGCLCLRAPLYPPYKSLPVLSPQATSLVSLPCGLRNLAQEHLCLAPLFHFTTNRIKPDTKKVNTRS